MDPGIKMEMGVVSFTITPSDGLAKFLFLFQQLLALLA